MRKVLIAVLFATFGQFVLPPHSSARAECPDVDDLWAQAATLDEQDSPNEAADVYASILESCPDSQRAAVKLAKRLYEAGRYSEALAAVDSSIAMNPYGRVLAEWGYLYKAKVCRELGCEAEARAAIEVLKSRFPDSISTTRAEAVEAALNATDSDDADNALNLELVAGELHEQAIDAANQGRIDRALYLLTQVRELYPESRKSLRSLEIKGLMLSRMSKDRIPEAVDTFEEILANLGPNNEHSRIRYEADLRLGYLNVILGELAEAQEHFHWLAANAEDPKVREEARLREAYVNLKKGQRVEASDSFRSLANSTDDPRAQAEASLQASGAQFEVLQRRPMNNPEDRDDWDLLREQIKATQRLEALSRDERSRADLMYLETFAWQNRETEVISLVEAFLQEYGENDYLREVTTARLNVAISLVHLKRYSEALAHLDWILERFDDTDEVWPGVPLMEQVLFYRWRALHRGGAEANEARRAAERIVENYPEGAYTAQVRYVVFGEMPDVPVMEGGDQ